MRVILCSGEENLLGCYEVKEIEHITELGLADAAGGEVPVKVSGLLCKLAGEADVFVAMSPGACSQCVRAAFEKGCLDLTAYGDYTVWYPYEEDIETILEVNSQSIGLFPKLGSLHD